MSVRPISDDLFSVQGRVAIVTGASGTLGQRYCRLLAARGATVVAAAREMISHGRGGSIVNVASMLGIVASGGNHQAGYVASKTGLIGLTRELAKQWASEGIRVNAIGPGYFRSELTEEMFAPDDAPGLRHIQRNTLMRRAGEIDEFDGALLLLASDAGSYITGQTIVIDGGWTAR